MLVPLARRLQAWPPLTHTGPPMNAALIISLMLLQAPDLQTRFPVAKNTYHDGNNDIVVIDYQSMNLPTSFLRIAKVLPGGMLLPVWLCSSGFEQLKMGEAMITNLPFSASRVTSYLIGGADTLLESKTIPSQKRMEPRLLTCRSIARWPFAWQAWSPAGRGLWISGWWTTLSIPYLEKAGSQCYCMKFIKVALFYLLHSN